MNLSIIMYGTRFCPYCVGARSLLDSKNVTYQNIDVDTQPELRREMMQRGGGHTVPQIWIGERHIGGYDDLALLEQQGELDELLKLAS